MRPSAPARVGAAIVRAGNVIGDELFPILVWLAVFGATRLSPSLILRLSIAVPQSMDFPPLLQWRRRCRASLSGESGGGELSADELSAQLADLINNTPSGSNSNRRRQGPVAALLPDTATWIRTSHHLPESLFSICTFPQRLLTYVLFQHSQRPALLSSNAAPRNRPVTVKVLLRLMTSFTATWVHASGNMLYDTLVTYLATRMGSWGNGGTAGFVLGNGGTSRNPSAARLGSGWRDLLVATCVSTGINFLLQTFWLEALTNMGERRGLGLHPPFSTSTATSTDVAVSQDDPTSSFTHVVLSTLARLGSKDTIHRLGRMVLHQQHDFLNSTATSTATQNSIPVSVTTTTATTAAEPRQVSTPPAHVYLCGGSAFVFALSGFRFAFYGDVQQLTTSVANWVTDALDLILRQANQRAAAQRFRSLDTSAAVNSGDQMWHPPVSLQVAGMATSSDVVLTPASSMQLLPIYLVNFAVGAGVGLVSLEGRVLLAAGRKIPLLRSVLEVLSPLPPPALELPEALQELSPECHILVIYTSGLVEVAAEDRTAPIVKHNETIGPAPPAAFNAAAVNNPAAVRARFVVAQDLFCPIKRTLMCDPVQTVDGFTYDRDGIEEWLRVHDTAPLTNLQLASVAVRVNWEARRQIETLIAQYRMAIGSH